MPRSAFSLPVFCRHGAEEVRDEETRKPKGGSAFKGSGYRLGDTEEQVSERVAGEPVAAQRRQVSKALRETRGFAMCLKNINSLIHV